MVWNQFKIRWRFYEMKFRIIPGEQSTLQGNSGFINKIEASDLILPPFTPSNIWLSFLAFSVFWDEVFIVVVAEVVEIKSSFIDVRIQ